MAPPEEEPRCQICERTFKSKAGLTVHQKRIHWRKEERKKFCCGRCGLVVEMEAAKNNHEKNCVNVRERRMTPEECVRNAERRYPSQT